MVCGFCHSAGSKQTVHCAWLRDAAHDSNGDAQFKAHVQSWMFCHEAPDRPICKPDALFKAYSGLAAFVQPAVPPVFWPIHFDSLTFAADYACP